MIEFTANARLFSAGRDIFWHKRACLTDAHIDELIFLLVFALECGFLFYHALASLSNFHYCLFLYLLLYLF